MKDKVRTILRSVVNIIGFIYALVILNTGLIVPNPADACPRPDFLYFIIGLIIWAIVMIVLRLKTKTVLISGIIILLVGLGLGYGMKNCVTRGQYVNNSARWSDVASMGSSIAQYTVDYLGEIPECAGNPDYEIPATETCLGNSAQCCDLSGVLIDDGYLSEIPLDPKHGTPENTGYTIMIKENSVICIIAPYADEQYGKPVNIQSCR